MKILLILGSAVFAVLGHISVENMGLDGPVAYDAGLVTAILIMVVGWFTLEAWD